MAQNPQATPVRFGVEVLISGDAPLDKKQKFGLVTNDAATLSTDAKKTSRVALKEAGFNLVKLFAPEHGIAAAAADGAKIGDGVDPLTKLPVISLYGDNKRKPSKKELADLDALMFDIPDIGARFYTYIWTLSYLLEACAEANIPLYVLDRPNPIGGDLSAAEGPPLDEEKLSTFVGRWNMPIRHSLTVGELALLWNVEKRIQCQVEVLRAEGWQRHMHWPDTKLPFVAPSPNMRTYEAALVYPGTCLVEGTNLSEGRGTEEPLRQIGAPWVEDDAVAAKFNALKLPGLIAKPVTFTPDSRKHADAKCGGVLLEITDARAARPVSAGLHLIAILFRMYPEQTQFTPGTDRGYSHFDRLVGSMNVRQQLTQGSDQEVAERIAGWTRETGDWAKRVHAVLQY